MNTHYKKSLLPVFVHKFARFSKKNLPYVIWTSQPVKSKRLAEYILVEILRNTRKNTNHRCQVKSFGPFSHVIAGTEGKALSRPLI